MAASKYLAASYWPYYLALLLVILLVVVLVLVIRRRRRKQTQGGAEPAAPRPKLDLHRTWRAFLRGVPREQRGSIGLYQPFIVLGAAGSGKSELIDRCLDWQSQAAQFRPSHTDDPLLQIYHGTSAVVQELSVVLLADASPQARDSLLKLWRPLRRTKEPRVVVVLDASSLRSDPPEAMVKQAQLIRGKINLLASVLKRPVKTSLALTHLDQVEGYLELSDFLQEHRVPLSVPLESSEALGQLESALQPFERYLPMALATRSPADYLRMLSFLRAAPELLTRVGIYLRALLTPDPATPTPALQTLSLTSTKEVDVAANPLAAAITQKDVARFRPLRRHQLAAAALAALGLVYLGGAYLREAQILDEAAELSSALTRSTSPLYPASLRRRFFDTLGSRQGSAWNALLPSFFADHATFYKERIYRQYLHDVRRYLLFPLLDLADGAPGRQKRALFDLVLLHGTEQNGLGKLVLGRLGEWQDTLELPADLIKDYLAHNPTAPQLDLPIDLRKLDRSFSLTLADHTSAELFFQDLDKARRSTYLSKDQLQQLRARAESLLGEIEGIDRNRTMKEVLDVLQREAGISLGVAWRKRIGQLPKVGGESMQKLISVLRTYDLSYPEAKNLNLARVASFVKQVALAQDRMAVDLRFVIAGQEIQFSSASWHGLVQRSRVAQMLQEVALMKASEPLDLFFPQRAEYPGLAMGASVGESFFIGEGKVNGFLTRRALEDHVLAGLKEMPALLKNLQALSLTEEDRQAFSSFVLKETVDYAERYVEEYRRYYRALRYRAITTSALIYIINQLQIPGSPLKQFLSEMERNTSLELPEGNPYCDPLQQISGTFSFLKQILSKPKGGASGLESYQALVGQLANTLSSKDPFVPVDENDPTNSLKGKLSPIGRVAFSIMREAEDSPHRAITGWLAASNIRPQWHEPFLGPVKEAYTLGLREINQTVSSTWARLYNDDLVPLKRAFPFDRQAEEDVQPEQLQLALNPKKDFWIGFQSDLAPFCSFRRGRWERRATRFDPVTLPLNMLAQVNQLVRLREALLDEKGQPRALTVLLKALPLPKSRSEGFAVVLSFLQVGEVTIYGFNQRPAWKELPIRWWRSEVAAVGAAFAQQGEAKKSYRNLSVSESNLSFYRLLARSSPSARKDKRLMSWQLRSPAEDQSTVWIQFRTKQDPWELFQAVRDKLDLPTETRNAGL